MGDDFHLRNGSGQVEFLLSNGISFGRHNVIVVSVTEGKTISDVKMGVFKWKQLQKKDTENQDGERNYWLMSVEEEYKGWHSVCILKYSLMPGESILQQKSEE